MMTKYEILKDKIVYFPGVITNIQDIINAIESTNSKAVSPWENWYAGADEEHIYGEIKYMKRELYSEETDPVALEKCKFIIESLCDYMADCAKVYAKLFDLSNDHIDFAIKVLKQNGTTIGINKYSTNEHMGPHVDLNDRNQYIQYTIVVYLNDDYVGGELHFPNHDITVKPIAGSIAMYPSGHPYLHESINITNGRKMLITHHLRNNDAR
jgi:hypothetical protein